MQASGGVNYINSGYIYIRENATSEVDTKVETEYGLLEAAYIYLVDETKFLAYITEEISVYNIEVKDIVIGDVYETTKDIKIVDARKGVVKRVEEEEYDKIGKEYLNNKKSNVEKCRSLKHENSCYFPAIVIY